MKINSMKDRDNSMKMMENMKKVSMKENICQKMGDTQID